MSSDREIAVGLRAIASDIEALANEAYESKERTRSFQLEDLAKRVHVVSEQVLSTGRTARRVG